MRRSDRLFELVQALRDGRLHRAADLAQAVGGVSVRTIWRDMATLIASGLPIEGERGVGYVLRAPTTLPPLMLSAAEMEALRDGLRRVAQAEDDTLARAARSLAAKIGAVAPAPQAPGGDDLFAFSRAATEPAEPLLPALRAAMAEGRWCQITHRDAQDLPRTDSFRPLTLGRQGDWRFVDLDGPEGRQRIGLDRLLALSA